MSSKLSRIQPNLLMTELSKMDSNKPLKINRSLVYQENQLEYIIKNILFIQLQKLNYVGIIYEKK